MLAESGYSIIFYLALRSGCLNCLYIKCVEVFLAAGDGGVQEDSDCEAEEEDSNKEGEGGGHESPEGEAGDRQTTRSS